MSALAPTLQAFFTERLIGQRQASPHTIAAYRDTFRLLLVFAQRHTGIAPHKLDIDDLDAPVITAFLDQLEHDRGNSPKTRNHRLAAIHSLYHYAALRHPERAATIARVLAIPAKRHDRGIVSYLTEPEAKALLAAPDRGRWIGRRDHALMTLAIQHGHQRTSARARHPDRRQTRPLPTRRRAPRLPRGPVIIPSTDAASPGPTGTSSANSA